MSRRSSLSRPSRSAARIFFGAIASIFTVNTTCDAAVFVWGNAGGGTYSTGSNWAPVGPPGAGDTARFSLGSGYTVNFAANQTASVLDVIAGTPTLSASGAGRTYSVTTATIHGGDLLLSGSAFALNLSVSGSLSVNTGSQFTINQGNDADVVTLSLGTASGAGNGSVVVDGAGSSLDATGTTSLGQFGNSGSLSFSNGSSGTLAALNLANSNTASSSGTLSISGGATVNASGAVNVGTGGVSGQSATLTVSGASSVFAQTGSASFTLGSSANSTATLTVGTGGIFSSSSNGTFIINPTGTANISGSFNLNGNLNIAGGTFNRQTGSTFSYAAGSQINVTQNGRFTMSSGVAFGTPSNLSITVDSGGTFGGTGSSLTLNGGATLLAKGGGIVNVSGGFNVAQSGISTADFQDSGTSLTGGPVQIGTHGGTGTLTFSGGANGGGTNVNIGEIGNDSNGTLNLKTGGRFGGQNVFIGSGGQTGAVGVVNVQDSGSQFWPNSFGSAVVTVGASSGSSGTINVTADGTFNMGTLHGACVSVGTGSGTFTLNPTGTLNINGGRAQIGNLIDNGGNLIFSSGALGYGGDLLIGAGGLLGTNLTLSSSRVLAVSGDTIVNPGSTLTLNGGEFGTGSLGVLGALVFNSGTLGLCGPDGFDVGPFELFGQNFTLGAGKAMFVGEITTVETESTLTIDGGNFSSQSIINSGSLNLISGSLVMPFGPFTNTSSGRFFIERNQNAFIDGTINNAGRIELGGGNARLMSFENFNNNGLLMGGGEVVPSLTNSAIGEIRVQSGEHLLISGTNGTNAGVINALGGTVEFKNALASTGQINLIGGTLRVSAPLTNSGVIAGRGIINTNGLTNNGQVQLSAGLTDVFGAVTGNSGSKVIVSGGATATFYNNVTMNSGSEFRVSTASTAVFFGNVSGSNFFTGSGIKDFEGGSSALGPVSTTGSTIAQSPASITASFFRENSLTVAGHVTIDTGGGTSHLNSLDVQPGGVLDLKNNSLVLDNGDLQAITAQIRSGLKSGTGIVSTAPGNPFRLGSMSNGGTIYSSFQGISGLNGDEVLIRYTRIGDLNLDGIVTISDFIDLASNFNHIGGSTWQMGDVNYDGSVTISDFIDLASNFNQSVSGDALPISSSDAAMLSSFAAANVPEPGASPLLLCGALWLRRRVRRGE